jgi:hypothetical protein
MTIEALERVIPCPKEPSDAYDGAWELIEGGFRRQLPKDYKDFARRYGAGYFMEYLGVNVPRSRNPNIRLLTQNELVSRAFGKHPDFGLPYPLWPVDDGLILFGATDGGDYLFWLPQGRAPNDWSVFVLARQFNNDDEQFEEFDCDMTDFLAGLATGAILPKAFPKDFLPCERLFTPSTPI